jgi:hypothetical protein
VEGDRKLGCGGSQLARSSGNRRDVAPAIALYYLASVNAEIPRPLGGTKENPEE